MVTTTRVRVDGLRELGEAMKSLGDEVGSRIARTATAAAAKSIKKRAVENIERSPSIDTGSLRDSVITKKATRAESGGLTSEHLVTVRGRGKPFNKKGQKIQRAPHAHLVEFGTVNMPAEPFLAPAFEGGKQEALRVIQESLRKGIERAVRRNAKGKK